MEEPILAYDSGSTPVHKRVLRKRVVWGLGFLTLFCLSYSIFIWNEQPIISPKTYLGKVDISDLSPQKAILKYMAYWSQKKTQEYLRFNSPRFKEKMSLISPEECGLFLNHQALEKIDFPFLSLLDKIKLKLNFYEAKLNVIVPPLIYISSKAGKLKGNVESLLEHSNPAKAFYQSGKIIYQTEKIDYELDESSPILPESIKEAYFTEKEVILPINQAKQRVPDKELYKIRDIVSTYSTKYKVYQTDRNYNLKLASKIWDGLVVMPGEKVSFNEVVGRRTANKGFRLATVFTNGKLDKGIGGGICQVSTTLYNAVALANLKIVFRANHSRPVGYVPLGRDATVVYGGTDFVFQNNHQTPISISTGVSGDTLTFRVLGASVPGQEIKITEQVLKSWSHAIKIQEDKNLPSGVTRILDTGGLGARVQTYRIVYQDGQEVSRTPLNLSYYRGASKVIIKGTGPAVLPVKTVNVSSRSM